GTHSQVAQTVLKLKGVIQSDEDIAAVFPVRHVQAADDVGSRDDADTYSRIELRVLEASKEVVVHPSYIQKRRQLELEGIVKHTFLKDTNTLLKIDQKQVIINKPVASEPTQRILAA